MLASNTCSQAGRQTEAHHAPGRKDQGCFSLCAALGMTPVQSGGQCHTKPCVHWYTDLFFFTFTFYVYVDSGGRSPLKDAQTLMCICVFASVCLLPYLTQSQAVEPSRTFHQL